MVFFRQSVYPTINYLNDRPIILILVGLLLNKILSAEKIEAKLKQGKLRLIVLMHHKVSSLPTKFPYQRLFGKHNGSNHQL